MESRYTNNNQKLLKDLTKGDERAYNYLVDMYYDQLCNYVSNLARDDFNSEDIVQNVIIKLWQRRKKLNDEMNIKSYLYKSVYNEFIDYYRKNLNVSKLEKKYIDGIDEIYESNDEKDFERLASIINTEIDLLPKKCRETFLLSKKEGLTYTEISEYQNVSIGTVEKQMRKAFVILRMKLQNKIETFLFLLLRKSV